MDFAGHRSVGCSGGRDPSLGNPSADMLVVQNTLRTATESRLTLGVCWARALPGRGGGRSLASDRSGWRV